MIHTSQRKALTQASRLWPSYFQVPFSHVQGNGMQGGPRPVLSLLPTLTVNEKLGGGRDTWAEVLGGEAEEHVHSRSALPFLQDV